jgi:hypothetical protein
MKSLQLPRPNCWQANPLLITAFTGNPYLLAQCAGLPIPAARAPSILQVEELFDFFIPIKLMALVIKLYEDIEVNRRRKT